MSNSLKAVLLAWWVLVAESQMCEDCPLLIRSCEQRHRHCFRLIVRLSEQTKRLESVPFYLFAFFSFVFLPMKTLCQTPKDGGSYTLRLPRLFGMENLWFKFWYKTYDEVTSRVVGCKLGRLNIFQSISTKAEVKVCAIQ